MRSVNAIVELPISNLFLPDSWKQYITPPPTHPPAPPHPHFSILNCWSWVTGLHWLLGLFGNFVMVKWTLNMKICNKIDLVQVKLSFQRYSTCLVFVTLCQMLYLSVCILVFACLTLHQNMSWLVWFQPDVQQGGSLTRINRGLFFVTWSALDTCD